MTIANVTLNNTFDEWRAVTNQLITFVNEVDSQQLINAASNTAVLTITPNKVARNQTLYITLNVSSDVLDTATLNVATANAVNIVFTSLANTEAKLVIVSDDANTINAVANAAIIQANTARVQANTARIHANAAFETANAGSLQASTARDQANTATDLAAFSFIQANTSRSHANAAFASANAGLLQANTARDQANNGINLAATGFAQSNTARIHSNAAFDQANTSRIHANSGFNQANTSYDRANAAYELAASVGGNTIPIIESNRAGFLQANLAYDQANTARVHANVSFDQANTARVHANAAFAAANNVSPQIAPTFLQANTARDHANASFAAANAGLSQANTGRDHANAAHATANASFSAANAGLLQANTARVHANQAFERANAALSNTSGSSFAGDLQIPTGNLTIGIGTIQGIRLTVNDHIAIANVFPQVRSLSGSQFIQLNSNTNFGGWNDLMLDRDISIIYSRGTSDDGANLIIGPWTDSSFGYKQDNGGRHGFNTSNPRYVLDANGSANISGSLLVSDVDVLPYIRTVGTAGNNYTRTVGTAGNNYMLLTGIDIGVGANVYTRVVGTAGNNYTREVGTAGNNFMTTTGVSIGAGANAYAVGIGVGIGAGANAYSSSATNLTTGTVPSARMSGSYTGITGVGTITTGTWNATDIALSAGGTGASLTAAAGAIAYSGASALALSAVGTSGQVLTSAGAGAPTWTSQSALSVGYATSAGSATTATSAPNYLPLSSGTLTGALIVDVAGSQVLLHNGSASNTPTLIQRNDGSNFYLLLSAAGTSPSGTFTTARPFNINMTTALVTMSNGLTIDGGGLGVGTAASGTNGEIRATNEVTAYYGSDINLKTNITPIEDALGKIRQISGVMFDWKDKEIERRGGEDGYFVRKHDTGIIAQEVEAVLPEVVATRDDGYKAVRYEKLAGLIIQAINELANEIDKLKSK